MEEQDPLEELREVRKKIVAAAGGTPAGVMRYLRALEKSNVHESTAPAGTAREQVTAL